MTLTKLVVILEDRQRLEVAHYSGTRINLFKCDNVQYEITSSDEIDEDYLEIRVLNKEGLLQFLTAFSVKEWHIVNF